MTDLAELIVRELDGTWTSIRTRLAGLTDTEYLWEPVDDCWNARIGDDGLAVFDFAALSPWPPPFTTIAWRLGHAGVSLHHWASRLFGDGTFTPDSAPWPATAAEAVALIDAGVAAWRDGLARLGALDADAYLRIRSTGPGHLREHGAEVSVLRDLYRATQMQQPFGRSLLRGDRTAVAAAQPDAVDATRTALPGLLVTAAERGTGDAVPLLLELGFDVNPAAGRSPLHAAVSRGDIGLVKLLVAAGANLDAVDDTFNSTPLGWAEFDRHDALVAYLRDARR